MTNEIFLQIKKLHKEGLSNRKIGRLLNLHYSTISYWLKKEETNIKDDKININKYLNGKEKSYSYILGMYLGDGYINKTDRTYKLRIFLDTKYPKVIKDCIYELSILFPRNKVNYTIRRKTTTVVYVHSNHLPFLFPQHGKRKKHERNIELSDWQKDIIINESFLKGLYNSDGSYYKSNGYYFYNFRNYSLDILNIYKNTCDKLNILYTETENTINHYKQSEVKKLYDIIGTKKI